jgi:hypothetical protein
VPRHGDRDRTRSDGGITAIFGAKLVIMRCMESGFDISTVSVVHGNEDVDKIEVLYRQWRL